MSATFIASLTTLLTLAGVAFSALALWSALSFYRSILRRPALAVPPPPVSILKPLKGAEPGLFAALAGHCRQEYSAEVEILCGVSSLDDPAAAEVHRLQAEFPAAALRLLLCPEVLGANGKVSNLAQMLPHAAHDHFVISDSDIFVSPSYLRHILAEFSRPGRQAVGMVTTPYRGSGAGTIPSRLEALAIATDFFPGVLTARLLERGMHFGLGSTLAVTREALTAAGGLLPLVDRLADDYQLGARIAAAGYRVILAGEIVETAIPAYTFAQFWTHQLRWARTIRDSRRAGYLGLALTYSLPWALLNVVASGADAPSLSLAAIVLCVRVTVAVLLGVGLLGDRHIFRDLWLLPVRDCLGLAVWVWSFAENTIVWRGHRFGLRRGVLTPEITAPSTSEQVSS